MRLGLAFQVALALEMFGSSDGFVSNIRPTHQLPVRKTVCRLIGQGWDNEDFLSSLSGGPDAMDDANRKYQTQTEQRGKLQKWRRGQQARNEPQASSGEETAEPAEEEGQGGSRFKELLEKSQQVAASSSADGPSGPILYNPLEGIKKPDASQAPDTASDDDDLTMEEQAKLFQKFMKMQQGGGGDVPAQQKQTNPGGKKVGRNRDADTIANTADVYFAQLKRDSTVRTIARYEGDLEKANAVFEDEGVKELENVITANPYLKEGGADRSFLDTSKDEMIAVMKLTAGSGGSEGDKPLKVPSYKEKLAQKKGKKLESAAWPPGAQSDREAAHAEPVMAQATPEASKATAQPAAVQPDRMAAQAVPIPPTVSQPEPASVVSQPQSASSFPSDTEDREEVRRGLRTLMGLILKHRGGPGFGKGRIKEAEAEGFDNLLEEITELLRSEVRSGGVAPVQPVPPQVPPVQQTPPVSTQPQARAAVQPPPQQVVSSAPPQPQVPNPVVSSAMTYTAPGPPDQRMTSTIACVDGAVLMYKNSPPEIQEGLMIPLRGALMSAVNTCSQIIVEKQLDSSLAASCAMATAPGSINEKMTSMIACVEGAVQMYKNSPPAVQEGLLVPLLGALMSAVNTCNQVIAEKEMDNVQAYQDAVTVSPVAGNPPQRSTTTSTTPGQFFEVTPYTPGGTSTQQGEEATMSTTRTAVEPEASSSDAAVSLFEGTDDNSIFLQTVYDSLEASSGDEKFGLKPLSSDEAVDLANKLVDMKAMLIEELDTGIPLATSGSETKNDSAFAGGSKYQQMLAKAKAEKEAK